MKPKNAILIALAVTIVVTLYFAGRESKRSEPTPAPAPVAQQPTPAPEVRVPPYHPSAESARPLPKTLPPEQFSIPAVAQAYRVAQRIPEVLAQQPCYCWCDKYGHGSLLDCYRTEHGAGWPVCVKEVLLANRMTREGKTPAQIREAIIRGDWQMIPLEWACRDRLRQRLHQFLPRKTDHEF